jgi:hypothetical protein
MSETATAVSSTATPPIASPVLEADAGSSHDHATAKASGKTLTAKQSAYAALDKRYSSEIKPFLDELKVAREAVIEESGLDVFFQDADGTVYHTADKKGTFVEFVHHEIQRTRREGESKGTLSLTAAKEAGFEVS